MFRKIILPCLTVLIGSYSIYFVYGTKYESGLLDSFVWLFLILSGGTVFYFTIAGDIKMYRKQHQLSNFSFTAISSLFIVIVIMLHNSIHSEFEKPNLVGAYYDGDINGTRIDFKTDGTYIFDNFAVGFSSYIYGTYSISGNKIKLDRTEIDNVIESQWLEIRETKEGDDYHLFQTDSLGTLSDTNLTFRIIEDNR